MWVIVYGWIGCVSYGIRSYSYSWSDNSVWVETAEIVTRGIPNSDILDIYGAIWCKTRNATLCTMYERGYSGTLMSYVYSPIYQAYV